MGIQLLISAHVMIFWFVRSSPASGSVLTRKNLLWILSPSLSAPPRLTQFPASLSLSLSLSLYLSLSLPLCLCLSLSNKFKKKEICTLRVKNLGESKEEDGLQLFLHFPQKVLLPICVPTYGPGSCAFWKMG